MRAAVLGLSLVSCSLFASPDEDGDGFSVAKGDCDDLDEEIGPQAKEKCDEVDNDCDGKVDNKAVDTETFYLDEDDDGYGVDDDTVDACEAPDGYADEDDDCDDDDEDINPGADDTLEEDRNCDGDIELPTGDDDDDDDVTSNGLISEASVTCSGTLVTFSTFIEAQAAGGFVFSQETGSTYGLQWSDNHSLEVIEFGGGGTLLERTLLDGSNLFNPVSDWQVDVSSLFTCANHYQTSGYMTYAFAVYDSQGTISDCVAFGGDVQGMINIVYDIVNFPNFDLSLCREIAL